MEDFPPEPLVLYTMLVLTYRLIIARIHSRTWDNDSWDVAKYGCGAADKDPLWR